MKQTSTPVTMTKRPIYLDNMDVQASNSGPECKWCGEGLEYSAYGSYSVPTVCGRWQCMLAERRDQARLREKKSLDNPPVI